MKQLPILAILAILSACNNNSPATTTDSTSLKPDSASMAKSIQSP